jgi:hypothetical protein
MKKISSDINTETDPDPNIAELAADYVEAYYQLTIVKINQKTADIAATTSFSMLAALICSFVAIFLGIGASLWLGSLLGNTAEGFLLVGLFCLVVFLVLFFTRKKLFYPIIKNMVIKSIYE